MRPVIRSAITVTMFAVWLLVTAPGFAQDPLVTLPDSYHLQFENEWVKVVRVRYEPRANLPEHGHPATSLAFVYLTDAEPVIFKHEGSSSRSVTRPAVKAGSYRLARGNSEVHSVESDSERASEFLRVELKTDPAGVRGFRRRVPAPSRLSMENATDVEFSNAQTRITRITIPAGNSVDLATPETEPALLVALTEAMLTVARASRMDLTLAVGQEHWIDTRQCEHVTNAGSGPVVLLRFDFLTRPR